MKTVKITCTVDRVEEGQAVCVSDENGEITVLSTAMSAGISEGDKVVLEMTGTTVAAIIPAKTQQKSENKERLKRLFDKFK